MLDHIGLDVSDITKSKAFYLKALKPLGYEIFMEWEQWVGYAVIDLDGHNIEAVTHVPE